MNEEGHVSPVVHDEVRPVALAVVSGPGDGGQGALPVLLQSLALPGKDGSRLVAGNGGGGVVLGGEDVAGAPPHVSPEGLEGLDEHGGLDGHVEGPGDAGALERGISSKLLAGGHQAGHLYLSNLDLLAAEIGQRNVSDFVIS